VLPWTPKNGTGPMKGWIAKSQVEKTIRKRTQESGKKENLAKGEAGANRNKKRPGEKQKATSLYGPESNVRTGVEESGIDTKKVGHAYSCAFLRTEHLNAISKIWEATPSVGAEPRKGGREREQEQKLTGIGVHSKVGSKVSNVCVRKERKCSQLWRNLRKRERGKGNQFKKYKRS